MAGRLHGKVAFITGAARGQIGDARGGDLDDTAKQLGTRRLLDCAPGAMLRGEMMMPRHCLTDDECRLECTEGINPRLWTRAATPCAIGVKGALEQFHDLLTHRLDRRAVRWRSHLRARGIVAVDEAALGDRPLNRHVAVAKVAPGEGVPPHEQHVENQDG